MNFLVIGLSISQIIKLSSSVSVLLKEAPISDVYVVNMILWSMMFFYLTKFMKNSVRYVTNNCNCYVMFCKVFIMTVLCCACAILRLTIIILSVCLYVFLSSCLSFSLYVVLLLPSSDGVRQRSCGHVHRRSKPFPFFFLPSFSLPSLSFSAPFTIPSSFPL